MKKLYLLMLFAIGSIYLSAQEYTLRSIGVFTAGAGDEATEILSYDAASQRAFVVNSDLNNVQVLSLANPSNPELINTIDLNVLGFSANSVDVKNGLVAVALEGGDQEKGSVAFFDIDGNLIEQYDAGFLPDMVTFTHAGDKVFVANEGEPNDDYTVDPEGSITIIDISNGVIGARVNELGLGQFDDAEALRNAGVRIFGPGASPAQDLEPEYVTISPDDAYAFVTCQENNAVLRINVATEEIDAILPLGYKDYSLPENGIDASDRSTGANIMAWPNVVGMYQPDGMDSYIVDGTIYFVTANEGDARDYDGYSEEERVDDLDLDPTVYPNAAEIQAEDQLGRLKTTSANGDVDNDGDYDVIYSYGARSFSIFDMNGNQVFDSGNEFTRKILELDSENYVKDRADDKASEPESVVIGEMNGETYAFIGLERQNAFFIYNITDPANANYAGYGKRDGDVGPEDAVFIPASDSPNGIDLLISSNEVSGTVTVFEIVEKNSVYNVFQENISIEDYESTTLVMPPSPLTTQVIFVGGHDIVQTTPTYGNPAGQSIAKEWHDFIGWTADDSGNSMGWVTVNHEMIYRDDKIGDGGGMTSFRVAKSPNGEIEVIDQTLSDGRTGKFFNIDFVNTVGETGMNCAGISAPNGRIWTAEEWFRSSTSSIYNGSFSSSDSPGSWTPHNPAPGNAGYGVRDTSEYTINTPEFPSVDGMTIPKYQNFNYMVEVDPKEAVAIRKQYNWGRAGWEGGAITEDGKYTYLGMDGSPAPFVRITANTPWDFTDVIVEVYKENNAQGERWVEVPMDVDNMLGNLTNYAWSVGATMFMRNEWVAIDQETGMVYWTETGRDGSSGAGFVFGAVNGNFPLALPAKHHEDLAQSRFGVSALDAAHQDYYGRVLYYDPATEEVGVVVDGGPYFEDSPAIADYPENHLSNPDGINIIEIDGLKFLMISEDLNGSSNGRMPEGISNRLCEMYLLPVTAKNASVEDLIRVTAVPAGAELTGAIQIDENTILFNSQHPSALNPFPYNHSLTMAIHGWADIDVENLTSSNKDGEVNTVRINGTTRDFTLPQYMDCAVYNSEYERIKVLRNTKTINFSNLESDVYYVLTNKNQLYKLIVE